MLPNCLLWERSQVVPFLNRLQFPSCGGSCWAGEGGGKAGRGGVRGATKKRRGPGGVTSQEFGQSESRQEPFVMMCHEDSDALGSSSST